MLGTLSEKQNKTGSYLAPLVHAYLVTRHDSTGFAPHYLRFGRFPWIAVDAFLGIKPQCESAQDTSTYVSKLKLILNVA